MDNILECRGIHKSFGGVHALKNVTFTLQPGEVHALVGENGAGKSTLIKIISGALTQDKGEIFYAGQPITIGSPKKAQDIGISTVYQEPLIYRELSVVENIFLGREIKTRRGSIDWVTEEQKARSLFETLEISPSFIWEPMGELSVGLQQLALIAKALSYEAKVIIFDEPTAILTEHETERLFEIIQKLKKRKVGIIYISHRLEEIFRIADRVTIMRDGEVAGEFAVGDINRSRIVELMAGRLLVEEIQHAGKKTDHPLLSVKHLTKKGRFYDISFDVFPGEILGFSGLVGSGRTDVAQTIFGLIRPDNGEIVYQDRSVGFLSSEEAMNQGIAYLPEDRKAQGLFPILTTSYNISITLLREISRGFSVVDTAKEKEISGRFVKELTIKTPSLDSKVYSLSGGNQQKVVLAKWLGVNPKVLILDEPTRGIDVASKSEIHHMIARLADQGIAIIIISSELPEILKLTDRVIVMHEGRITGIFTDSGITSENLIRAATGERMLKTETAVPWEREK
ncbi:MAG: sugar ABC transporter ATP-binding protein [Candidatus Atribacteria bacterium]|nr:sugar ABC transporter ATP-binding protein [Candidatus Atribacteria bacterium]